jgi:hypothetical protein
VLAGEVEDGWGVVAAPPLPVPPAPAPELPGTPGFCVMSVSWVPSAIGPEGLAKQEPGGETGLVRPKGIVPGAPTCRPPTKVVGLEPWNWHWKRPLSSGFLGAVWQ